MSTSSKYNPNVRKYSPMGSQSDGNSTLKYVAYRPERLQYSVETYTHTPEIPEMPKYNPAGRSPEVRTVTGYTVVDTRPSILQRFIASMRRVGGNLKKRILKFFRRDKRA